MSDFDSEEDIVNAIEAAMQVEPPAEVEEAPAPVPTQEIQPQAAPEAEQPTDGVNDSEEAKAPVVESPAPVAAEAPKPLLATPEKVAPKQDIEPSAAPEADAARNQTLERINNLVQQLEVTANTKFADLKSEADVLSLMQTDPARYNEFVIAQTQYQRAKSAQAQVQQEAQKAYLTAEQQRLARAIPELSDPEKGEALKAELRAYAKSLGIPDNRQARSADEVIRLHAEYKLAKEVEAFRAEKAAQAKALEEATKKAAKAPAVQQPGVQRDTNKDDKASSDFERFDKSGDLKDLARFLQHLN